MAAFDMHTVEVDKEDYGYLVKKTKCQSCKYQRDLNVKCKHCKLEMCYNCAMKKFITTSFVCKIQTKRAGAITKHDIYLVKDYTDL